jgi:hypothetical protein
MYSRTPDTTLQFKASSPFTQWNVVSKESDQVYRVDALVRPTLRDCILGQHRHGNIDQACTSLGISIVQSQLTANLQQYLLDDAHAVSLLQAAAVLTARGKAAGSREGKHEGGHLSPVARGERK